MGLIFMDSQKGNDHSMLLISILLLTIHILVWCKFHFMLSVKLNPKIYSVDLHFVLYVSLLNFGKIFSTLLLFMAKLIVNHWKWSILMPSMSMWLYIYLDWKFHVWDFIAFGTLCYVDMFYTLQVPKYLFNEVIRKAKWRWFQGMKSFFLGESSLKLTT